MVVSLPVDIIRWRCSGMQQHMLRCSVSQQLRAHLAIGDLLIVHCTALWSHVLCVQEPYCCPVCLHLCGVPPTCATEQMGAGLTFLISRTRRIRSPFDKVCFWNGVSA